LMMLFVMYRREELLEIIIEEVKEDKRYINKRDKEGNLVIYYIIYNNMYNIMRRMLEMEGIEIGGRDKKGNNILHYYAMKNERENDEIQRIQIERIIGMMSKGERRKYIKMRNKGGDDVIEKYNKKNNNRMGAYLLSQIY
jgi:hypothetical protein